MAQERMDREMAERMQAEALQERENGHTDESDPGEGHSRSLPRAASKRSKSKNIDSVSSSSAAICKSPADFSQKMSNPSLTEGALLPAAKSAATVTRDPSDILAKPKRTYSQLISEALLNAQNKMLPLNDIYGYISSHYPFYRMESKGSKAWQNAIRHNLTLNPNFEKVARPSPRGRGNFWRLSDDADLRDGRGRGKNRNYIDASGFRDYEEYRQSMLEAASSSAAAAAQQYEEEEEEGMYMDAEQPQLEVVIKEEAADYSGGDGEGEEGE